MVAVPCVPNNPAKLASTFASGATGSLGAAYYGNTTTSVYGWTLYTRNATTAGSAGTYITQSLTDTVAPGVGYWLKSNTVPVGGGKLVISGSATPVNTGLSGCTSSNGCVAITVGTVAGQNRYNLVGNPFPYNVAWADVRVQVDNTVYTPTQAQTAGFLSNALWIWNGNNYDTYSDTVPTNGNLQYFSAFWVNVLPGASGHTVKLLIPAQAALSLSQPLPTEYLASVALPGNLGWPVQVKDDKQCL